MKNKEVSRLLTRIAELLSLKGESSFRIRAYEQAGVAVESWSEPIEDVARREKLCSLPGIGESIAEKIKEYLDTGSLKYLENLKKDFPPGIFELMDIPGMGPRKAKALYDALKVSDISSLRKAIEAGKLRGIRGFGRKTEENILKGIALVDKAGKRMLLNEALLTARQLIGQLQKSRDIQKISTAGSLRRYRETIGDIDILCAVSKGRENAVVEQFVSLPQVQRVLARGETKVSILTDTNLQVDLRIVHPDQFGAALQYFTGSKDHNVALRGLARDRGLTINEYGIFKIRKKGKPIASKKEEDIYRVLGMPLIPVPLRENRGEIEAALKRRLPKLVELSDIKGDTHVHSRYSDGSDTIEEIGAAAQKLGYEWLVVSDHSQSLKVARGLSIETLRRKMREIRRYNEKHDGVRLLCGTEVDILNDGSIDYPEDILEELDYVVASIHTGFKQSEEQITHRIIKAIENPYVNCIAHPSGRLLNKREPYAVDLNKVLRAARDNSKLIEINAYPDRLDLQDIYCKKAKEIGVKLAIGTDSHSIDSLANMELGIAVAQRGWLEKGDVINTLSYSEFTSYLEKQRRKLANR